MLDDRTATATAELLTIGYEGASIEAGETEAIILIKAAPVIGTKHGETLCCAGLDLQGNWLRMYPVSFRVMDDGKKFKRWDRVKFKWHRPTEDQRIESRHVDSQSPEIVGRMPNREKAAFFDKIIVTGFGRAARKGAESGAASTCLVNTSIR